MLDVNYIKDAVNRFAFEDMSYDTFGTWGHAHIFKPVLPESEVAAWEETLQIKLPQDYRLYLTQLGNGGPGPAYGIAPFKCSLNPNFIKPCLYSDDEAEKFNAAAQDWFDLENTDDEELYERYYQQHPNEPRLSFKDWDNQVMDANFDELEERLFNHGQVMIANQGCSLDIYLILNGSETGRCHCTNTDYDYSYPVTNRQSQAFKLLPEPRPNRPALWPEYKESLQDFEQYLMSYVKAGLKHLDSYTAEQLSQFQRERELVLEFEALMQSTPSPEPDEIVRFINKLETEAFSIKTRNFFLKYASQLAAKYPNQGVFTKFETQLRYKPNTNWVYTKVVFEDESRNNIDYPHPTFAEFKATFRQP